MKTVILFVFLGIAGAYASSPVEIDSIHVTDHIRDAIDHFSRRIRESGLDPYNITKAVFEYKPLPAKFEVTAFIDELVITGVSNIVINNIDYSFISNRIKFELSYSELRLFVGNSGFDALVFGKKQNGRFNGSLSITQVRFAGEIHIKLGIISGVSVRSLSLQFSVGDIKSNLRLIAFGSDHSEYLNRFCNNIIPVVLKKYKDEINKYLALLIMQILKQVIW